MANAPENNASIRPKRWLRSIARQWREDWRDHLVVGTVGVFLALAGAFDTQSATLPRRLVFWVLLLVAGSFCAGVIKITTSQRPRVGQNRFFRWLLITLMIAVPISLLAWVLGRALFGAQTPSDFVAFVWVSVIISGATTALMMLVNTPGVATTGPQESHGTTTIRFLARLPDKLDGAVIYSVKAEDHYLSVHTSKGSALILSRLSDAIAELDGIEGAQVHRSWWVARDAIASVRRTRNAVSLELRGGVVAPVSRSNVKALRASGWI